MEEAFPTFDEFYKQFLKSLYILQKEDHDWDGNVNYSSSILEEIYNVVHYDIERHRITDKLEKISNEIRIGAWFAFRIKQMKPIHCEKGFWDTTYIDELEFSLASVINEAVALNILISYAHYASKETGELVAYSSLVRDKDFTRNLICDYHFNDVSPFALVHVGYVFRNTAKFEK